MHFSDTEIASAVRVRLAQLDKNNDLPLILMPLSLELDSGRPWPDVDDNGNIRPMD